MNGDEMGRFAFDGLDRAIHEKARLGIMTSLVGHPKGLAFSDLKRLCDLTDGNLNRHLQVLQDAELVAVIKTVEKNRPLTIVMLTTRGQKRFVEYLDVLESLVREAREEAQQTLRPRLSEA